MFLVSIFAIEWTNIYHVYYDKKKSVDRLYSFICDAAQWWVVISMVRSRISAMLEGDEQVICTLHLWYVIFELFWLVADVFSEPFLW